MSTAVGLKSLSSNVLDATSCLLVVTEIGTGVIVGMNKAAEDVSGISRDQVIGLRLWDVVAPAQRQMLERTLTDPWGHGLPESFESTVNLRSGNPHRIVWSSAYLTDDDGARAHVVLTGIDMSAEVANGGLFAHLMGAANAAALVSTDRRGRVTYCSSGTEQLLGFDGDRLVGHQMPLSVFDPSELRSRAAQMKVTPDFTVLTTRRDADRPPTSGEDLLQVRDWTLTRSDGTRLIASVAVYAARDTDGHLVGFVGVAHDVTEQHRLTRVLAEALVAGEQAAERLLELDRAKTSLVTTMSHEIRTPLSSIMGYTELLHDGLAGEISADQRSVLDKVDRNCERLVALADDLVAIAQTDAGPLDLDLVATDMCGVVSAACDSMRTVLLDRTLETFLELPDYPLIVHGDAVQLTRAVVNLLNNAVKFTDDDGKVRCRLTRCGADAVLLISDNGVGIPRAEQRDLFHRFFRSSTSHERETQGSGLGLSIVASIVDQHGGQILVDSDHMQGAAFTVRIPLLAPAARNAA